MLRRAEVPTPYRLDVDIRQSTSFIFHNWLMSNAKSNTLSTGASMVMLRVSMATAQTSLNMGGLQSSYSDARQLGWRALEEKVQARTSRTSARCLSVTHRSGADEANTPDAHAQNRAHAHRPVR